MQQILIKYRPISWLPLERSLKGSFPTSWEELSPDQFTALATLSSENSIPELVTLFTGLPQKVVRRMDPYQLARIWWITDWVHSETSCNRLMIPRLGFGLTGPKPGLRGMSFGRFIFCDMAFEAFQEKGESQDLHRFLGSLYLPEGFRFAGELPGASLPLIQKVPERTCRAILFNYTLVRRWLAQRYPLLFSLSEGEEADSSGEKPSPKPHNAGSWIRVFDSLVGEDISRHQEYADIPLHNVLRYLTARTKENMKKR